MFFLGGGLFCVFECIFTLSINECGVLNDRQKDEQFFIDCNRSGDRMNAEKIKNECSI